MSQGQFYPIRPPSETARVAGHGREIERLQRRNPEPRWMYVTPVAPATAPDDYRSGDTLYPAFQSPWGNLDSDHLPFSYRFAYGGIQIRGSITGDEGTPNSLIATIPSTYPRPTKVQRHFLSAGASGELVAAVDTNPDGTIVFVGVFATATLTAIGSSGTGISYDTNNTGDWLEVATTGGDPNLITTGASSYTGLGASIVANNADVLVGTNDGGSVFLDGDAIYLNGGIFANDIDPINGAFFNYRGGYFFNYGYFLFGGDGFEVDSSGANGGGVFFSSTGDQVMSFQVNGADMTFTANTGKIQFLVGAGPTVAMEIHNDGSIHIPSGTSIQADL